MEEVRFLTLLFLSLSFCYSAPAQISFWGVDITGFDTATSSPKMVVLERNPYFSHVRIQYSLHCAGVFVFGGNRMKEETPERLEPQKYSKNLADFISAKLGDNIPVSREMNGNCTDTVPNFYVWKKKLDGNKWITALMIPSGKGYIFQTHLHTTEVNANEYIYYEFLPRAGGINNCINAANKAKFHLE